MILYGAMAYYFASKMVRLIILMAPVASALAGVAIAWGIEWALAQFLEVPKLAQQKITPAADAAEPIAEVSTTPSAKKKAARQAAVAEETHVLAMYGLRPIIPMAKTAASIYASKPALVVRVLAAVFLLFIGVRSGLEFWRFADVYAERSSQPSIKFKARLNTGQEVMINDYLDAYNWLRENTPADSRVLSWWDYGYQIAGIGNRTTLADGNTWNLEHIATIGRILTAPEKKAHSLARYLADYVLVWAGNQGDDLAKSPHMARIASSVYSDVCVDDPSCRNFGFYAERKPTPSMAASMLYKMHSNGVVPGVTLNSKLFKEVHTSKYGLVRIYQVLNISTESKEWLADPANRLCDAPGSWYCVGQYPPGFPKPPK
jgi:dolichyl-diphosphooligosaccharide--protein glycosyltransferase